MGLCLVSPCTSFRAGEIGSRAGVPILVADFPSFKLFREHRDHGSGPVPPRPRLSPLSDILNRSPKPKDVPSVAGVHNAIRHEKKTFIVKGVSIPSQLPMTSSQMKSQPGSPCNSFPVLRMHYQQSGNNLIMSTSSSRSAHVSPKMNPTQVRATGSGRPI